MAKVAPQRKRRGFRAAYLVGSVALAVTLLLLARRTREVEPSPQRAKAAATEPRQPPRPEAQLLVQVFEGTRALAGARVTLSRSEALGNVLRGGPTGASGTAQFSGLQSGEYSVRVEHNEFPAHEQKIVLAAAPLTLEVLLTKAAASATSADSRPAHRVLGRVVSHTGQPIAGASVGSDDPRGTFATTNDDGAFELRGFGDGPLEIFATAPGYAAKHRRGVAPGSRNVTLQLEVSAAVRGALDWPSGAERVNVSVCHYDEFFRRELCIARRIYRPATLGYEIPSLPSGPYDLVAEVEGRPPQRFPLKLAAGAVLEGPRLAWSD